MNLRRRGAKKRLPLMALLAFLLNARVGGIPHFLVHPAKKTMDRTPENIFSERYDCR